MKSKTRVLLYLILAALACAQSAAGQAQPEPAQAETWSRYTYPGEEFSAELPSMPQVFHTSRKVSDTTYESEKVRVFGLYSRGVVYMLVSFDKPRNAESDDDLAGYAGGGALRPKGDVKLGGVTGREYDVGPNVLGTARFFRTKRHAYLLKAFSNVESRQEAIERFLNTFTLGTKPSGELIAEDAPVPPFAPSKETPTPAPQGGGIGSGRGGNTEGSAAPRIGEGTQAQAQRDGGAAGKPLKVSEVSRKAVIVFKPEPGFTEDARRSLVIGVVRLRAILSSSGKVRNISVVKSLPNGLTDKAITAARHMLFFPAVKDGREVSQYVVLEYNFNIY